MSRLRQLGKDSVIYGLGGILAKGIGILLLPIYTRIFSPADYGTIEMLSTIASLLGAIIVMGMDSAQSFYFFEQKGQGTAAQARVVTAILQWQLLWGTACVVIATLLAPLLNAWLFKGELTATHFFIAFASVFFLQVMTQSAEVFRLLYRPWSYVLLTAVQTLLAAGLVLTAVLVFDMGILGFFAGSLGAGVVVALIGWWQARDYLTFDSQWRQWWPRVIHFGWPLLPAGLAFYVMSASDRWFIQEYRGAEELGLYAVAARFALTMSLAVEMFRKAWWPMAMDAMHGDDGPETFRMIARLYMAFGVAAVVILTFLAPWLVRWLTAPIYHDTYPVVGILAWQALFYGFFLIASAGIWKAEKTSWNIWLMGGAALANIAFNVLLVPYWGGAGAAFATAVTFLLWTVMSYIVSERFWPIHLPVGVLGGFVSLGMSAQVALWILQGQGFSVWEQGLLAIVIAGILLIAAVDAKTRQRIRSHFGRTTAIVAK